MTDPRVCTAGPDWGNEPDLAASADECYADIYVDNLPMDDPLYV
jgi:hypothetical protein